MTIGRNGEEEAERAYVHCLSLLSWWSSRMIRIRNHNIGGQLICRSVENSAQPPSQKKTATRSRRSVENSAPKKWYWQCHVYLFFKGKQSYVNFNSLGPHLVQIPRFWRTFQLVFCCFHVQRCLRTYATTFEMWQTFCSTSSKPSSVLIVFDRAMFQNSVCCISLLESCVILWCHFPFRIMWVCVFKWLSETCVPRLRIIVTRFQLYGTMISLCKWGGCTIFHYVYVLAFKIYVMHRSKERRYNTTKHNYIFLKRITT